MQRIAVDCRFASTFSGLGRYTREIASHLLRLGGDERYVLLVRSAKEEWLSELQGLCEIVEADIPHYSLREQTHLPRIIRDTGASLLFSPHFNVPILCPIPFVTTIHDLILHRFPNRASLPKQLAYRLLMRFAVTRSQAVIAISAFVHKEITDAYGQRIHDRTTVIWEGVDVRYRPEDAETVARVKLSHGIERPYFLYVGNAKQHKNVPLLIDAFRASGVTDADLILVSGGPELERILPLPPNVRVLKGVSDEDLPALYSGARALLTASLYEGFCLPVAEALACGCPVIAANRTAIPEIASGRAVLLEPTVEAFADAIKHPPHRAEPFVIGRWEDTAKRTHEVLCEAMKGE